MEEMWPSPVARRLRTKRMVPSGRPGLVGMRDDGGIEERGGLERIFVGEVGADEKLALVGKRLVGGDEILHGWRSVAENNRGRAGGGCRIRRGPRLSMATTSASGSASTRARMRSGRSSPTEFEGAEEDAAGIGPKNDSGSGDVHRFGFSLKLGRIAFASEVVDVGQFELARLLKGLEIVLEQFHFAQGDQIGEGRFGALVEIDAVDVQAVATAAGRRIIERKAEIVAAKEPLEGEAGFLVPDWRRWWSDRPRGRRRRCSGPRSVAGRIRPACRRA